MAVISFSAFSNERIITVIETWEKCRHTHRILKFGNWIFFSLPSQYIRIAGFKYHINLNRSVSLEEARYHRFLWLVDFIDSLEESVMLTWA